MSRKPKAAAKTPEVGANLSPGQDEATAEIVPLPGLPVVGARAAVVLGLKLTGQWNRRTASTLAAQWAISSEAVYQTAAEVDAHLDALMGKEPARRLVVHQLLLALRECDQVVDPAKRIAARKSVTAELSKVMGVVTKGPMFMLSNPGPLSAADLRGKP